MGDLIKTEFKYYKSRVPPPDLSAVVDFSYAQENDTVKLEKPPGSCHDLKFQSAGLRSPEDWKIFTISGYTGFFFILNPFFSEGQQLWIKRCLCRYPQKPNRTNLNSRVLDVGAEITSQDSLLSRLSWVTLGYHHDWDKKIYDINDNTGIPEELQELATVITSGLGFEHYRAEAAIINYYDFNSTLRGHTDHSEIDLVSPLLSVSFGQSALFLLGGKTKAEKPCAMFLRSGDIVVMSGSSRLAYHAVPRILSTTDKPWITGEQEDENWTKFGDYVSKCRINMNIRQMFPR